MTREAIYKEIEKTKRPLSGLVGMVLRPGALVDFTLKSKQSALKFAKSLSNLESVQNVSAHADTVVEVRIDFIPLGFPTKPISEYLINQHGEILTTPIRITDRFNIQTGTRVFKMERKDLENNPIPSYLYTLVNTSFEFAIKVKIPLVATAPKKTTLNEIAPKRQI